MTCMKRRFFLKTSAASTLALPHLASSRADVLTQTFTGPDSLAHGPEWKSLNPGYWQIKDCVLRRRLKNYGDRARQTGFPYHYETHQQIPTEIDYNPSLPHGVLCQRD